MVILNTQLTIKLNTKQRFLSLLKEFKTKQPDYKINQDYVLRKLMDKYEGDQQ